MADQSQTDAATLRSIFMNLRTPVAVLDHNKRISAINPAWQAFFAASASAAADPDADLPHEPPAAWLIRELDDFTVGGENEKTVEKPVQTAIGKRQLAITLKRLPGVDEKPGGCLIMLEDVTRQRTAESAFHETTIWLTEMFNVLEEAVFICTPDGRIVDVNKAARQIFGYSAEELKGRTTERLHVDRDHFKTFTAQVWEALARGKKADVEYVAKRKNGEVFPARVKITLLKKKDLTPLGIVSVVRDISTLKLAEKATRSSERLQGALELAGAVCHDLNQPLMAITGYAELILMDCPEDAPYVQKLKKIVRQATKMGDITKKLMHVTRYETKTYLDQQIIDIEKASSRS
jgi:PAS domain S-box-containing protein